MDIISLIAIVAFAVGLSIYFEPEKENSTNSEINIIEIAEESKLPEIDTNKTIRIDWWREIYQSEMLYAQRYFQKNLSLALGLRHIVIPYSAGFVKGFYQKNGEWEWSYPMNQIITAGIVKHKNLLLAGGEDGLLIALDNLNGKLKWQTDLDTTISSISSGESTIYAYSYNGRTFAIDDRNGEIKWTNIGKEPNSSIFGASLPIENNGNVYVGNGYGLLIALNQKNGSTLWQRSIGQPRGFSDIDNLVDLDNQIIIQSDNIITASYNGKLISLNRQSQVSNWEKNMAVVQPLVEETIRSTTGEQYHSIVTIDNKGIITAVNSQNGETIWQNKQLKFRQPSQLYSFNDLWITIDKKGVLFALNKDNGLLEVVFKEESPLAINALSNDEHFFWLNQKGQLMAAAIDLKFTAEK